MKKFKFAAFAALAAMALSFAACSEDKTDDPKPDPKPEPPTEEKSDACDITSFKLVLSGGEKIDGKIFAKDKEIEVVYKSTLAEQLKAATAEIAVSEKATISPDPTVAADYSASEVTFTVTAEDGKATQTYKILMEQQLVTMEMEVDSLWTLRVRDGNDLIAASNRVYRGAAIGVSGTDIVISNTFSTSKQHGDADDVTLAGGEGAKVFDKDGQPLGDLNMEGLGSKTLIALSNDTNGVLLGSINNPNATDMDGEVKKTYEIWAWKSGWQSAPERTLNSTSNIARHISITGDINGLHTLTAQGGNGTAGAHFCWTRNGQESVKFTAIETAIPSNDGSWSQNVSPAGAEWDDPFFMYDSFSVPGGGNCMGYVMTAADAVPEKFAGPGSYIGGINGEKGWGGHSFGSFRAFSFFGDPYVLSCTTEWGGCHFTIITNKNHYPFAYQYMPHDLTDSPASKWGTAPCAAYYFNKAENCGYAYFCSPGIGVAAYKIRGKEVIE